MQSLDIEKFSPKKAELIALAEECKDVNIFGVEDSAGYSRAQTLRMRLKNARVEIQKTGKAMRADALAFQKLVIEREKELVALIEPTERELEAKQQDVDDERERLSRVKLLPERKELLLTISLTVEDDALLSMSEVQFQEFFNLKHAAFLEQKELAIREEGERLEREKHEIQEKQEAELAEKRREAEIEQARKDGEAQAKREAEEREAKEIERKGKEEADKKEGERQASLKLASDKQFQSFLASHGYTEEKKREFVIQKRIVGEHETVVLFKQIGEITL